MKYAELSTQQKENPSTLNLLMVQIQKLQDKVNSFNDAKEFCDPETASSSGLYHIPSQPMSIPAAIHACSLMHGTACVCVHEDTFLNVHLLEVNHPQHSSRIQRIWHLLLLQRRRHRLTEEKPRKVLAPGEKVPPEGKARKRPTFSSKELV